MWNQTCILYIDRVKVLHEYFSIMTGCLNTKFAYKNKPGYIFLKMKLQWRPVVDVILLNLWSVIEYIRK